jgi:hypothetical protein
MLFFSDTVFSVNESVTDYLVTFSERLSIDIHNATVQKYCVTQDNNVTFEFNIYPNGTGTMYKGYLCVTVQMLTSQQDTVDLVTIFKMKTNNGSWYDLDVVQLLNLAVHSIQIHNFTLLDHVMNETSKVLGEGGILTIRMIGFYLIHSQHTIATSHAEYNAETHISVHMSYAWTGCNLTYPNKSIMCVSSGKAFAGLGVAEFHITLWPEVEDEYLVSVYSQLANTQGDQPLRVRRRFELINSTTTEHGAFDQLCMSDVYEDVGRILDSSDNFNDVDFLNSIRQQCVTLQFFVCM